MLALFLLAALIDPSDDPITEVSLQRTPCFGTCPVDKVILHADGTAEYEGTLFVERMGKYKGRIAANDFKALATLVAQRKFFDLNDRYAAPVSDQPTLLTSVRRGATVKEVSDYGGAGPDSLKEIEKRIVELMDKIEWKPELKAPGKQPGWARLSVDRPSDSARRAERTARPEQPGPEASPRSHRFSFSCGVRTTDTVYKSNAGGGQSMRVALVALALALGGCETDGGPGPVVRLLDGIVYPNQTHCYARKLKPGATWKEPDGSWSRLGEDERAHPVSNPSGETR
jgi:hypothetical protein